MNVAILMPLAEQRGGAEQLLRALMRCAHGTDGISWLVVFFQDGPLRDELDALGVPSRVVPTGRLRQVGQYVSAVRHLAKLFRQNNTELVFSWMGKAHLYGSPAAWMAGVSAMWYQHGTPRPRGLMDRLATLLPAQGILACSRAVARVQGSLWPARPVRTAHPCVDLERFDPEQLPSVPEACRELALPVEGPLVGIVGRLQRWKGIHVFVEAMGEVLAAHPNAHGVIVGGRHDLEPDYADEVEAQIKAQGLEEHITLAGFQSNVPEWMQAMDVVVHASDHEPFGIVIIEAMALGKPVVAGASGGPPEIITEGVDGLLAPYGDGDALAEQILRFLNDPALRRSASEAARRRAQDFSPERYAQNFIRAIGSLS